MNLLLPQKYIPIYEDAVGRGDNDAVPPDLHVNYHLFFPAQFEGLDLEDLEERAVLILVHEHEHGHEAIFKAHQQVQSCHQLGLLE